VQWGLVNHVYPADGFEQKVQEFAARLAEKAPLALARSKKIIRAALEGGSLTDALAREAQTQEELIASHDFREGVMAFLEKRPARYEGR
jgi:2-(1,2-epoxy-1,2-dihydrophenyl)acetyl-CoA isomerase